MYCPKCGASVAPDAPFCSTCGATLRSAPAAPPPQYGAPATPQYAAPAPAYAGVPATPQVPAWDYATWGTRALGYIVDALLVGVGMAVLYLLLGAVLAAMLTPLLGFRAGHALGSGFCCFMVVLFPLATLLVGFYNNVYLLASRGYSIGQGVVHVKTVDGSGNLLTMGAAIIRLLVRVAFGFVPFLPLLDLLWPLWDVRRQTLHDKAVNSYVVNMR